MLYLIALVSGIAVGLLAGALGIGGGVLAVPILVYILGQPPHAAIAESLVIVLASALAALPSRIKRRQLRLQMGLAFGVFSSLGAIFGSWLNAKADPNLMMFAFGVMLCGVAILMFFRGLKTRRDENNPAPAAPPAEIPFTWRTLPVVIPVGFAVGILVGFFGIGGGFIVVPVLMLIMRYSIRVASGTSFAVIIVSALVSLATRFGFAVDFNILIALAFALGSAVGSAIGSPLSNRARASTLTFIFVVLLAVVATAILVF